MSKKQADAITNEADNQVESVSRVHAPPQQLGSPDIWRIIVAVRGCGTEVAKRQAEKMVPEDQKRLLDAFQQQVDVRGVMQAITDKQADAAIADKAAKVSESAS